MSKQALPGGFYWHDARNFLLKLTPRRLFNAIAVYASFYLTRLLRRPIQWGLPFSIAIEPTTACNLRCPECPSGLRSFSRATGNLKSDFFRATIDDLAPELLYLTFYFQGEPFINPAFLDMVQYAHRKKIYTATSTNGHFFDDDTARRTIESGLDRLIISIDGATQDVYEQYRIGGRLQTVLEGAERLVYWKNKLHSKTPHIIFQCLVVRPNEHQIEDIRRLARRIGVDELRLKSAQVYNYENGHPLIPTIKKYARYHQQADGSWQVNHQLLNHCWKLWHSCVITWDGMVVPCCFDKDASHQLGNLRDKSLKEWWRGTAYHNFRSQLLKGRREIDICTNCTEGCKPWR